MRFNNPQYPYLVKRNINILDLLNVLQKNKTIPVVVVNNDLSIYGVIAKGDLINYLSSNSKRYISVKRVSGFGHIYIYII